MQSAEKPLECLLCGQKYGILLVSKGHRNFAKFSKFNREKKYSEGGRGTPKIQSEFIVCLLCPEGGEIMLLGEFVESENKSFRNEDGSVSEYLVVTYSDVDAAGNASRKTKDFSVYDDEAKAAFLRMREGDRFECVCRKVSGVSKVSTVSVDVWGNK